eukprot:TRINITY_DN10192_c0_g1_i1.p1 TRINITY_DN10192_c0_g1~~TRINITY_DN10192_c0_g1_i1.p1  ORF type:complete len:276 (-),score=62.48 TRINITY_DN10192_c0_g1_i1:477-1304(-)
MFRTSAKPLYQVMFEKFDSDKSGAIDASEFQILCRDLGVAISEAEFNLALKLIDQDGSGKIELNEFKAWWTKTDRWAEFKLDESELKVRQKAAETFAKYDESGTGLLSKGDYSAFYDHLVKEGLTKKNKDTVFADLDKNNDGSISFAEYVEWLVAQGSIKVKVVFEGERRPMVFSRVTKPSTSTTTTTTSGTASTSTTASAPSLKRVDRKVFVPTANTNSKTGTFTFNLKKSTAPTTASTTSSKPTTTTNTSPFPVVLRKTSTMATTATAPAKKA